ncbi:type I glutamate--ammonia ligase [Methanosphaera sp. WGK6]|uniref:type I glutamate--ammonia ligase n=1 Tax=Methanosphaera sp. WGK6 TaxID=1561964 RepID=UPI00084CC5D8|nr:type I glutamate--ammonia ligase [Methanosphaera sp. WGK6]OED30287.1 glutamine synthetase [Methanosphaera sp. WGK6]
MSTQDDKIDEVIKKVDEYDSKFMRFQFVDIHGTPKSLTVSLNKPDDLESIIENGLLFDGSSVAGFVGINDSDLELKPDLSTFSTLPWRPDDKKTCRFICDVYHTDGTPFEGDPRGVLKKSLKIAEDRGYQFNMGPEPEFFLIDKDENGNYIPADTAEYFDVEPLDQGIDIKKEIILGLEELNFNIEVSHHEVAPGQQEIDFRFDDALKTADAVITFKQTIKALVDNLGYKVTFMPKPFYGINGSGMHCNQSLFKDGKNIFYDPDTETQLSQEAMYFIGGLLKHSKALSAILSPTINSYKRLVPGYEAPCYIAYGFRNRSTLLRIPASRGLGTRIECRSADPSCNPYLAFAVLLEAGLDGMDNKIEPGEPTEFNAFALTPDEIAAKGIDTLPTSLWEAYHSLEKDEVVKNALGDYVYNQFYNIKRAEWDDYRTRVFDYELDKYLNI